ncbi:MAG: hypothetical protein BWK76_18035 [Desulfobulbaceae bacterium A2]|nr:MAG: hypothetical protein BWK76_18035 [Desulfobulbaceae bacterium A2]
MSPTPTPRNHTLPLRRGHVVALFLALLLLLAGGFALFGRQPGWWSAPRQEAATTRGPVQYTCPMHPEIVTNEPGDCPICSMSLVPIEDDEGPAAAAHAGHNHPAAAADDFFGDLRETPLATPVPPSDRVTVRVKDAALRAAGVRTEPAVRDRLSRSVRTVGLITADEGRIRHVHTKVDGWVESLAVNFNGQLVAAGQPILTLYSPTLLTSQEEFLRARETATRFSTNADEGLRSLGQQLFDSARRRLALFDVPESFIAALEQGGQVSRTVTLNAPVAGFVTAKSTFEGQQIVPGQELFTITDLSRVWIEASLYEYEAGQVQTGQQATLTLPHAPGVTMRGRVSYINPFLTPESRTIKVRFEFDNPDTLLKPAMYADVTLDLASVEGIIVPEAAVMDTGVRKLVFVEIEPRTFEPREVQTGVRGHGRVQITSGIRVGEAVVVQANFLLDSESRLRAGISRQREGTSEGHSHTP